MFFREDNWDFVFVQNLPTLNSSITLPITLQSNVTDYIWLIFYIYNKYSQKYSKQKLTNSTLQASSRGRCYSELDKRTNHKHQKEGNKIACLVPCQCTRKPRKAKPFSPPNFLSQKLVRCNKIVTINNPTTVTYFFKWSYWLQVAVFFNSTAQQRPM